MFLLNSFGISTLVVFVIGFKPDVAVWSIVSNEPLSNVYDVIMLKSSVEAFCSLYDNSTLDISPPLVSKSDKSMLIKLLLNTSSSLSKSILSEIFKFVCNIFCFLLYI